jgi:hypothetical protein
LTTAALVLFFFPTVLTPLRHHILARCETSMDLFASFTSNIIGPAVSAVAVTGCFALARVLFRYQPPAALTAEELAELAHRTRNYDKTAAAFAVVVGLAVGFGFWAACRAIAAAWDRAMPEHVFLYRTTTGESPDIMWAIPAFFVALIGGYWGHVLAIRLLFGANGVRDWLVVCNHKAGFDGHRFLKALSVLTVAGSVVAAGMLLDCYTRVEENQFVENEFFGFGEKSHPYTDVKMIARTSHVRDQKGEETERSRLHISFTDGTTWAASPAEAYQPLTEFLVRKTGKPLLEARVAEQLGIK